MSRPERDENRSLRLLVCYKKRHPERWRFLSEPGEKYRILNKEYRILKWTKPSSFDIPCSIFNIQKGLKQSKQSTIHFADNVSKMFIAFRKFILVAINHQ